MQSSWLWRHNRVLWQTCITDGKSFRCSASKYCWVHTSVKKKGSLQLDGTPAWNSEISFQFFGNEFLVNQASSDESILKLVSLNWHYRTDHFGNRGTLAVTPMNAERTTPYAEIWAGPILPPMLKIWLDPAQIAYNWNELQSSTKTRLISPSASSVFVAIDIPRRLPQTESGN